MSILQKTTPPAASKPEALKPLSDFEEIPLPVYNFSVEVGDVTVALFQSCSGISVKRDVEQITEGGLNDHIHELPGQLSYGHVTLETGLTSSQFFWKWMMSGTGKHEGWVKKLDFTLVQRRPNPDKESKVIFQEIKKWNFFNAFPINWKISDLSVTDSDKIVLETLELAFDYFELGKS
jgi:phage tail-like protein